MTRPQPPRNSFGKALQLARKSKGLSQEAFGLVSSRTYISTLERNMKSPTLSKVEDLAGVLKVHPLTLLALSYLKNVDEVSVEKVLSIVNSEISDLNR